MKVSSAAGLVAGVGTGVLAVRALVGGSRRFDLSGRVALITGGSRGLGLALAREFVRQGAKVAICARDEAELEKARRELEQLDGVVFAVPADITDPQQVERVVARVREEFGEIDVLVNNAGVTDVGPLESMTVDDFDQSLRTHFYGPLYFTLACVPDMRRRRAGRVINIAERIAVPHLAPYSAGKFALTGLSEALRSELAKDDVFVTTVVPGVLRTGGARHAHFKGHPMAEYRWFRVWGALPGLSMEPHRAARKIVSASQRGQAELVLSPQTKVAVRLKALFPQFSQETLQLVGASLPDGYGATTDEVEGMDLEPPRGGSLVDRLQRFWALRLNEYAS